MSASSESRPPAKARPRIRRTIIGSLVLINAIAFGAWWILQSVTSKLEAEVPRDSEVVASLDPMPGSGEPRTFLVIGSDSRAGLPDDFEGRFGSFAGKRADVAMLVQVFPEDGRAQILSIPRDLRVEIEGYGTNRINAAYSLGGASLMVDTVRAATGLAIHHYVEVDFFGFASIVEEIGGVHLEFPYSARDAKSGLDIPAGTTRLDGAQALAYARSRQYQEYRDGRWVSVDGGDIGRTRRQQLLVFAIISDLKTPSTILDAGSLIETMGRHLTLDAAISDKAIIRLAWDMRGLSVGDIEAVTLPVRGVSQGGRSYVVLEPEAEVVLAAFALGSTLVTASEEPLRLQVLNGNGVEGSASLWADTLRSAGFNVVSVADADSYDFVQTVVLAPADRMDRVQLVISALGVGGVVPGSVPRGVDAVVIIGQDLNA